MKIVEALESKDGLLTINSEQLCSKAKDLARKDKTENQLLGSQRTYLEITSLIITRYTWLDIKINFVKQSNKGFRKRK